jgi:hypothetical protein
MTASFRGEVWVHKTILTPPLFVEVPLPNQESERSCICVLGVSNVSLFPRIFNLILELATVQYVPPFIVMVAYTINNIFSKVSKPLMST